MTVTRRRFLHTILAATAMATGLARTKLEVPEYQWKELGDSGFALSIEEYAERYIEPAMRAMAVQIDEDIKASSDDENYWLKPREIPGTFTIGLQGQPERP